MSLNDLKPEQKVVGILAIFWLIVAVFVFIAYHHPLFVLGFGVGVVLLGAALVIHTLATEYFEEKEKANVER